MDNNETRTVHNQDKWDIFEEPPDILDDVPSEGKDKWVILEKGVKLVLYVIIFIVILVGSVVSKGILLFITAQLSNQPKPYCNQDLGANQQFIVVLPQEERVAWMWILTFLYFVPQLATFLRSSRILIFKHWNIPSIKEFVFVFIGESLSTVGNGILVFYVLPRVDSVKGCLVMNCLCLVPAVLSFSSSVAAKSNKQKIRRFSKYVYIELFCIIVQCTGLILLTFLKNDSIIWCTPISIILISFGWWENYMSDTLSQALGIKNATTTSKTFPNSRYFSYSIVSLWKCALFMGIMNFIEWCQYGRAAHLFSVFESAFDNHDINVQNVPGVISYNVVSLLIKNNRLTPIWLLVISISTTYFSYAFGKFACKINIQRVSYSIPLNLSSLITVVGLLALCNTYNGNSCAYSGIIPLYLFFNLPVPYEWSDLWLLFMGFLLFLSFALITIHIWNPLEEDLPSTEMLYVRPYYEPFFIDQDLAMNRRRSEESTQTKNKEKLTTYNVRSVPKLYICGTMWHETKEEMLTFLKSVLILDEDQCCRRIARNYLNSAITSYYKLESHVIFDDAFKKKYLNDQTPQLNDFVNDLIISVDDAVSMVYKMDVTVRKPIKYSTPYGGRLEWILPGKSKLVVHLKDSDKIRPKKRWSQVMYLYYILGHRIAERDDINDMEKDLISKNTYILAVDGDIYFRPPAVHALLEQMRKQENLAAACGRVHPVGHGIFAWYQKFEYALSHWMYKASECITGCVLCCPGCFTIFRATAVMSVLKKLTTQSTKPVHFIKYDHGEDRWISTLLVLCGYKVGYVATSDAYTNCPEGFKELYNQRRRWIPSTTANVLDLLSRTHTVRRVNQNVSILYMIYQSLFNIITIIGPSLVFWIFVNTIVFIFQIAQWLSLLLNIIFVMIYVAVCAYVVSEKVQIQVALIMTGIYAPIMCCFFINTLFEIISNNFLSPWLIFFCLFLIQVLIVTLLHPREIYYLKYFLVYYAMMPTMNILLFIYSVFNMHTFSWGTREIDKCLSADTLPKTSWLEDESLGNTANLSDTENIFWARLLAKYLYPIDNTKENKIKGDLKEFRDKVISTFLFLNIMFISVLHILTSKNVTVKWHFGESNHELELFNTILILSGCALFLVQIVAIFFHRLETFSQIMSNTKLQFNKKDVTSDPVTLIRNLNKKWSDCNETNNVSCRMLSKFACRKQNIRPETHDFEEMFLNNMAKECNNGLSKDTHASILNGSTRHSYTNHGYTEDV